MKAFAAVCKRKTTFNMLNAHGYTFAIEAQLRNTYSCKKRNNAHFQTSLNWVDKYATDEKLPGMRKNLIREG
jgi:hypothetical protein